MQPKSPIKNYHYVLTLLLLILILMGYLGYRTIKHQTLLNHYQTQEIATNHINTTNQFVTGQLNRIATHLQTLINFNELTEHTLNQWLETEASINNIFILKQQQITYPLPQNLTQEQKRFIEKITPILKDPSLLYSPNIKAEGQVPHSGWYIDYNNQTPLLIYWQKKHNQLIGIQISYTYLLAKITALANFNIESGHLKIIENDRLLYQSKSTAKDSQLLLSKPLDYPLTQWRIDYYSTTPNNLTIYLWGTTLLILLLITIGLIFYRIYREYTYKTRLALQQVNFVNQVSHELKTPLTNICLYAELLKENQHDQNIEAQNHTDIIINESKRLSRLIQNILNLTKTPKPQLTPTNLTELLHHIAQTFTPSLQHKGITLQLNIQDNLHITTDKDKVTQIIGNFLNNAEKYAPQGKQINISTTSHIDSIDIHIRDYGNGIPTKEQKLIFHPFYRIQTSITEGVSGTGIGLTIAKQLAENLNGKILITSHTPGVCFTLKLPINPTTTTTTP